MAILGLSAGGVVAMFMGLAQVQKWLERREKRLELRAANPPVSPRERALQILMERYAKGEIDRDEFLERRGYIELEGENP